MSVHRICVCVCVYECVCVCVRVCVILCVFRSTHSEYAFVSEQNHANITGWIFSATVLNGSTVVSEICETVMIIIHYSVVIDTNDEEQRGTTYIRWGRKTCERNATLVYEGTVMSCSLQVYTGLQRICQGFTSLYKTHPYRILIQISHLRKLMMRSNIFMLTSWPEIISDDQIMSAPLMRS